MKSFNKNVTSQMKAIAFLMMLAHHLTFGESRNLVCLSLLLMAIY